MAHLPNNNVHDKYYSHKNYPLKKSHSSSRSNISCEEQNIYDPLYERYQREHSAKSLSEQRLHSLPWHHIPPSRSHSDSQVISNGPRITGILKKPKKTFNLFGRKQSKKYIPTSTNEMKQQPLRSPQDSIQKIVKDPIRLVPGLYPPHMEAEIVRKMKESACSLAKQGLWEQSYFILKSVLRCEMVSLGKDHPQVANTLYHIGVALNWLDDSEAALSALQDGIQILFPERYNKMNVDLAAMFYQYGTIQGKKGDYLAALYHLDLAGQVEIHIFGHVTEKTGQVIKDYKYARSASRGFNQIRSRSA